VQLLLLPGRAGRRPGARRKEVVGRGGARQGPPTGEDLDL
jgi:hypothetical protein